MGAHILKCTVINLYTVSSISQFSIIFIKLEAQAHLLDKIHVYGLEMKPGIHTLLWQEQAYLDSVVEWSDTCSCKVLSDQPMLTHYTYKMHLFPTNYFVGNYKVMFMSSSLLQDVVSTNHIPCISTYLLLILLYAFGKGQFKSWSCLTMCNQDTSKHIWPSSSQEISISYLPPAFTNTPHPL